MDDPDLEPFEPEVLLGSPEPPGTGDVRAGGMQGVTDPVLVHHVKAVFPEEARKAKAEGRIILSAVVTEDGEVRSIDVLWKPDPDLGFSEAAIAAVSQWRYEPGQLKGRPIPVRINVQVEFYLV